MTINYDHTTAVEISNTTSINRMLISICNISTILKECDHLVKGWINNNHCDKDITLYLQVLFSSSVFKYKIGVRLLRN